MESYKKDIESLIDRLGTTTKGGLTPDAVELHRRLYGRNTLKVQHTGSIWLTLFRQFTDLLVLILVLAGLLDFYLGQYRDGTVLIVIVSCNALIGFYQERKAENILGSLQKLVAETTKVIRGGTMLEIPAADLVPGDLVSLYEGDGVPADIRLVHTTSFSANEFILTGESLPAEKDSGFATDKALPLTEMRNSVFMGTTVARGEATGIVYATGMQTEIGKISLRSKKIKPALTPVQIEAADIARKVMWGTVILAIPLFATRLVLHNTVLVAVVFTIGVAAAMVPEGLPAQISTALALGVRRMARKNAIVKRIAAVETLGSATVIATDKTGTITRNEMTITGCRFNGGEFSISGLGYSPEGEIMAQDGNVLNSANLNDLKIFFLSGYLSSTGRVNPPDMYHPSWYSIGDPTEASFSTLVLKAGYTLEDISAAYPAVRSFPFDSSRKKGSVIRRHKGKVIAFVKGALEEILASADRIIIDGQVQELDQAGKAQLLNSAAGYAANGYRIIALAYKDLPDQTDYLPQIAESGLTYAGFVTMLDPPHDEVKKAIAAAFSAHIRVFMITGDNEVTAKAVAKSIGLMNEGSRFPQVISGYDLGNLTDEELKQAFNCRALIFSRVSPDGKYRIVDLLKKQGEIVAVTGDGVNDTLSLKRADIGIAMGRNGSRVAQEASTVILLDDNFSTITYAVREGRIIFRNIEKTAVANLTGNIAELTCVLAGFAGAFVGVATPLLVMQILAIDMMAEMFPLMMLTFDPAEEEIMAEPPRDPRAKILRAGVVRGIVFRGLVMGLAAYAAFLAEDFHNHHLSNHYEKATTVTYVSIFFGQMANLLSRRTTGSVWGRYLFSNRYLWGAIAASLTGVLLIVYLPFFNLYFHTSSLYLVDWAFPVAVFFLCLVTYEWQKRRKKTQKA